MYVRLRMPMSCIILIIKLAQVHYGDEQKAIHFAFMFFSDITTNACVFIKETVPMELVIKCLMSSIFQPELKSLQ